MYNDIISDALTRLRNAARATKAETVLRRSAVVERIIEILKRKGYVESFKVNDGRIEITMSREKPIVHLKRLSKPGIRRYVKAGQIPRPRSGRGVVIVSTPKGLLTGSQAAKQKVGGELICEVW